MLAVAGAGLLFGVKVLLNKRKDGSSSEVQQGSKAESSVAERRASEWLSNHAAQSLRSSHGGGSVDAPPVPFTPPTYLDEGYLVCFQNASGQVLCVQNVGSHFELAWQTLSRAPDASIEGELDGPQRSMLGARRFLGWRSAHGASCGNEVSRLWPGSGLFHAVCGLNGGVAWSAQPRSPPRARRLQASTSWITCLTTRCSWSPGSASAWPSGPSGGCPLAVMPQQHAWGQHCAAVTRLAACAYLSGSAAGCAPRTPDPRAPGRRPPLRRGHGKMLRASGGGSSNQHVIGGYQVGSYELWRQTPLGLFNIHFKNKVGRCCARAQLCAGRALAARPPPPRAAPLR